MLVIGGLGLYGLRDVSLGLMEEIKTADIVFLEEYTSITPDFSKSVFEKITGKTLRSLSRKDLENGITEEILEASQKLKVVFLTFGNPLIATTHAYLVAEAYKRGIEVKIIPAPSVIDAILCSTGLHIYKFGRVATLVYPQKEFNFYPYTSYRVIGDNLDRGLHTLLLLDIKAEENKYMSIPEAAELLMMLEEKFREGVISPDTIIIAVSRALTPTEEVFVGKISEAISLKKTAPPHSIVIPGILHDTEIDFLQYKLRMSREVFIEWNKSVGKRLRSI
ncbi:MAG: diphthine synthase [Infirmifilum sp.]|jgi:diphthine synthase|uniref:diphthine synthase n=1 Tax=Infirmifilum TaxID=2856573 RepID=UPI00069A6C98|nr:diphthine synthase [Infirmifilum uzonense]